MSLLNVPPLHPDRRPAAHTPGTKQGEPTCDVLEGENRGLQVMPKHPVKAAAGKIYVEEISREVASPGSR